MEKEYYISREQFIALKEVWKKKPTHSASEMIIYNILRSKPADNGFCQKTKNIQGNDPWYGFEQARWSALSFCSAYRIRARDPKTGEIKYTDEIERTLIAFKLKFGIDMPEDIKAKISESKK